MQTFLSTLALVSTLFNPSINDAKMCKELGYTNWHKIVYEKGTAKEIECYDKHWKKQEIKLTTHEGSL